MVSSPAPDPDAYIAAIEDEGRRDLVSRVRDLVNEHLPEGVHEGMAYGMIGWADMGKSCVRVKRWDDVAPEALANAVAAISVEDFLGAVDAARG